MSMSEMRELYVSQLKELYSAEQQILRALPNLARLSSDQTLKATFEEQIVRTEEHVRRLDRIFAGLGEEPFGRVSKGLAGLVEEENEALEALETRPKLRDAALLSAAQRVEHYEIAGYGAARTYAESIGDREAAQLLQETLDDAGHADKRLTRIALSTVNEKVKLAGE